MLLATGESRMKTGYQSPRKSLLLSISAVVALQISCSRAADDSSDGTDSTSNTLQSAMAEANSQASASESSSTVGFVATGDAVDPRDNIRTEATACSFRPQGVRALRVPTPSLGEAAPLTADL